MRDEHRTLVEGARTLDVNDETLGNECAKSACDRGAREGLRSAQRDELTRLGRLRSQTCHREPSRPGPLGGAPAALATV